MQNAVEGKTAQRGGEGMLMAEFSVQVFSNGQVDWDGLERYVRPLSLDVAKLLIRLEDEARRR